MQLVFKFDVLRFTRKMTDDNIEKTFFIMKSRSSSFAFLNDTNGHVMVAIN